MPFELRLPKLHREDGRESLAHILALEVVLLLLQQSVRPRVVVERARQCALEAREVGAALMGVDVVGKREHRLDVRAVPLHRHLDRALLVRVAIRLDLEVDDVLVHRLLRGVDVRNEVPDPALVVKLLALASSALVGEHDAEPPRQERRLAEALRQHLGRPLQLVEDVRVRPERDGRPGVLRRADRLHIRRRFASRELLAPDLPVAMNFGHEPLGQRVHDRHANAVEATGHLVALAAELPARVELREDDGERRQSLVGHHINGNA